MSVFYGGLSIVTAASAEPITTSDAMLHLRVDEEDERSLISSLISAARGYVEVATNSSLVHKTYKWTFDRWPRNDRVCLFLPKPPLVSIESVEYLDKDYATQVWDPAEYLVDVEQQPGRLTTAPSSSWPDAAYDTISAGTVTYVAGYGAGPDDVPDALQHAMRLLISHWYEHREAVVVGTVTKTLELAVESLLISHSFPEAA